MREMTNNGLLLCRMQAELFASFFSIGEYSPYVFIRRFMNSNLVLRFDHLVILGEISSNSVLIDELDKEYGSTDFGNPQVVDKEILYWVGYIYRYWAYVYDIPSCDMYKYVKPKLLIDRYYLYHSMDPQYTIERIIEEEKIQIVPHKTIDKLFEEYFEYLSNKDKY